MAAMAAAPWERVLRFWFGPRGSARELQERRHALWFVPDKDAAARARVDGEVREEFGALLVRARAGELDEDWAVSARSLLALVLVLDQVSRHVHRGDEQAVRECTLHATRLCVAGLERDLDAHLRAAELAFFLMPLRHYVQLRGPELQEGGGLSRRDAMSLLEARLVLRGDEDRAHAGVLERFVTATDRRALLQLTDSTSPTAFKDSDLLDPACLGLVAAAEDDESLVRDPVYQSILGFVQDRVPRGAEQMDLVVSLSGGVDSMVIAFVLAHMARTGAIVQGASTDQDAVGLNERFRKKCKAPAGPSKKKRKATSEQGRPVALRVCAVHIDYANREESGAEADFVARWCAQRGIAVTVRRIDHLTRGVTARDTYEREARKIRFEMYKAALGGTGQDSGVFLGHHKGDVQENVVSNVMKGCAIQELSGMTPESVIDGVRVWRPLLPHVKDDIFALAHRFAVPYFKDTTPKWSTRGKLRDQLMPTIAAVYGEGFRHNLSALADQSDELDSVLREHLFNPLWNRISLGKLGASVPLTGFLDHPFFFWKSTLRHVCHSLGTSAVKDRPAFILAQTLNSRRLAPRSGARCCWVVLKKHQPSFISLDHDALVLFRTGMYHDFARHKAGGLQWRVGDEHDVGPFRVAVAPDDNRDPTGAAVAFDLLDWVATGTATFRIAASESGVYTLDPNAGKSAAYFKGVDRRVRELVPILAAEGPVAPRGGATVVVSIRASKAS